MAEFDRNPFVAFAVVVAVVVVLIFQPWALFEGSAGESGDGSERMRERRLEDLPPPPGVPASAPKEGEEQVQREP